MTSKQGGFFLLSFISEPLSYEDFVLEDAVLAAQFLDNLAPVTVDYVIINDVGVPLSGWKCAMGIDAPHSHFTTSFIVLMFLCHVEFA